MRKKMLRSNSMPKKLNTIPLTSSFFSSPKANSSPISLTLKQRFSESTVEDSIKSAEIIITKWDIDSPSIKKATSLFHTDRKEAGEFLKCVEDLRRAMKFMTSQNSVYDDKLVLSQNLLEIAMKRLEKEVYKILSDCEDIDLDEIKVEGSVPISDLKSIAECMIKCGYGKECVNIFILMRKSTLEENLSKLGIDRFKSSGIHKMKWEALEDIVRVWLRVVRVSVKTLFNIEKLLSAQVFTTASFTNRESCFCEIIRDSAMSVFKFPQHVAEHKRSPKNTFRLMELYESISDLWPEIDSLFCSELSSDIKSQALSSLGKLAKAIHNVLSEFETSIKKDSSRTLTPGGGIHQLSQSATNYISSLSAYAKTLSDVLTIHPSILPKTHFEIPKCDDPTTENASIYLAWLILVLLCKIDTKAALYKDVALSYLFLANNLHFILEKVLTSNLETLLGDEWIATHARKVRGFASKYEDVAWNKVFLSIPEKNSTNILSREAAKECFKKFNLAFEEAYRKQRTWTITDGLLRDEMKLSIAKKLVPVYRDFSERYIEMLRDEKNLIRCAPEDLENYFSDLFLGNAVL